MWQIKNVICPLSKGLWTPNLAGCWLRWGNPTHKSSGTSNTWSRDKSKMLYVPLSQGLWIPNLASWWLRMKGTHPQCHVTHWSSAHVTNQEDFTFTLTWRKAHKLSIKRALPPNIFGNNLSLWLFYDWLLPLNFSSSRISYCTISYWFQKVVFLFLSYLSFSKFDASSWNCANDFATISDT